MSQVPLNSVISEVKKMTNWGSKAKQLAQKHKLDVMNVTWEDNARNKNSSYGPCISDMTLQVDRHLMPVIRTPNFSDKTWDVNIEKIPVVVGNEKKGSDLKTVTLKEYLKSFDKYMSKPTSSSLNLLASGNTKQKDSHVIMSSQACFLPVEKGKETKFNVALFNYQSYANNPAVLVIVSTSKGSSAQIIEGNQSLYFNNEGIKAEFVAQRLTDNRIERGVAVEGEMTKQEKQDNVIVIIQVPLKQKPMKIAEQSQQFAYPPAPMSNYSESMTMPMKKMSAPVRSTSLKKEEKPDVEAAIVKVVALVPKCNSTCNTDLVRVSVGSQECYNGGTVQCDKCSKEISVGELVWHCPKQNCFAHKGGYDLCNNCGEDQLKWDELHGLSTIEREEKYPIRVTLQYYQATSNGVVDETIMSHIATMLETSQKQADFVGSLVTQTDKNRPTEWIEEKSDDKFSRVKKLLQEAFAEEWANYFPAFEKEKFDDTVLNSIDNKDDLSDVLSKGGDRIKFFKVVEKWKRTKNDTNFLDGLI